MHLDHRALRLGTALLREPPLLGTALLALALAAGCARDSGDAELPPAAADSAEALDDAPAELVPAGPEEPGSATLPADRVLGDPLPEEIYYSLDEYEWYRQALPIVHDGVAFEALDTVLVLSTLEVDSLGRFGGVLYWARTGVSTPDTVFVPVFEGYWLPFASTGPRP